MKRYLVPIALVLIAAVVLVPLLLYVIKFGSRELSSQFKDWESFSNYWTVFLSLAATSTTAILAYYAYEISKQTLQFTKIAETPRVTFEMLTIGSRSVYIIKNAGKVPAVNCFLFIQRSGSIGPWDQTVNCYTIKPDEVKIISWVEYLLKAEMHYQSFSGESFTTTVDNQMVDFALKKQPNHVSMRNYSEVSVRNIEDEVIKLLNGSSENKDDMKMLTDFILSKAKDCNGLYFRNQNKYQDVHSNFFECLNEIIISLQVLDEMIEEIKTIYIKDKRAYFLKIFWIQLDVGIRHWVKEWHAGHFSSTPNPFFNSHLKTVHGNFEELYEKY